MTVRGCSTRVLEPRRTTSTFEKKKISEVQSLADKNIGEHDAYLELLREIRRLFSNFKEDFYTSTATLLSIY